MTTRQGRALHLAKVAYVPGETFHAVAQEANHSRVNDSGVSDERIAAGIVSLGTVLRGAVAG